MASSFIRPPFPYGPHFTAAPRQRQTVAPWAATVPLHSRRGDRTDGCGGTTTSEEHAMVTRAQNVLLTRVEGDAPLGQLMRANYWIPFALSENLSAGDAPTPVRLFGESYIVFRAPDGRIGFLEERCPHRRASLLLARVEGDALRCIYHGWKLDLSGRVVEAPTQAVRQEHFCASIPAGGFPVHEEAGIAWVWLGDGGTPPFPDLPFHDQNG